MNIQKIFRTYLWIHVLVLLFAAAVVTVYLTPLKAFFFCPFNRFLHLYCPVCGGTRAFFALLRGELLLSLMLNPTVFCLVLSVIYYEAFFLIAFIKKSVAPLRRVKFLPLLLTAGVCVLFFLLRNALLVTGIYDAAGELLPYWQ